MLRIVAPSLRTTFLGGTILGATATLLNRNFWPISSYNMFNDAFSDGVARFEVDLLTFGGWEGGWHPANLFPVPFFRAVEVFERVYLDDEFGADRRLFSLRVLQRLNEKPWNGFNEVRPAARPSGWAEGIRVRVVHRAVDGTVTEQIVYECQLDDATSTLGVTTWS